MSVEYDVVVIGGGSGGLVVASIAAQLKAKVALVERDRLGGDCLWTGCVPSKSIIHASRLAYDLRHAAKFGISANDVQIDFAQVMQHVNDAIAAIQPHDSPERFQSLGVDVIFGDGKFISPRIFAVNERQLTARAFAIATGSRPKIPSISGLEAAGYLTNEQVFHLQDRPVSLAVIGGGPIGCELGQALSRLGTEVTMIVQGDRILSKEEPEAAQVVEAQLRSEGIRILTNSKIDRIEVIDGKKHIYTNTDTIICTEILVSTGRTPNVESLDLPTAQVQVGDRGIIVNQKLQTTNPRIYACGDVVGNYQFTHVAGFEAVTIAKNALFFPTSKVNYDVIPWCTFTDPELARVGLTETEARKKYNDIWVLKQDYANVDRAQADGATQGFAKLICKGDGTILGAHLVGKATGELIHEIVLAMSNNLKVSALTGIHIYPTLSELNSKAALQLSKQKYANNHTLKSILEKFFNFRRKFI